METRFGVHSIAYSFADGMTLSGAQMTLFRAFDLYLRCLLKKLLKHLCYLKNTYWGFGILLTVVWLNG